jgi:uncharacterized protein (DUF1800 family)
MSRPRRLVLSATLLFAAVTSTTLLSLASKKSKDLPRQMDDQKRALHALNRLTFGPRPGDVQRVMATGVDKWIDLQLHPDRIDDKALDARLTQFRTLHMDTHELVENFPPPPVIKAVMEGKEPLPSDPVKRAIYQAQIERLQQKQERKQEIAVANASAPNPTAANGADAAPAGAAPPPESSPNRLSDEQRARRREDRLFGSLKTEELLSLPPDQRVKEVLKLSPEDQRALAASLKGPKADQFLEGMSPKDRETMIALNNPEQVINEELMQAKLLRAIYSDRQFEEVMTDFWFNHFNVFINKGPDRYFLTSYERDVIRPHALGKFEDLLVATAKSPAMLFYLDNWLSVGPDSQVALGVPKYPPRPRRRYPPVPMQHAKGKGKRASSGLNENYGRELMELHTLGVNGGYSQHDVTEVARVFTGWTIEDPRKGGAFKYDDRMHEPGDKLVLGHRIKYSGQKEGMQVLHLLAHNPATAHFVCNKIAMRFVSDTPPPALVDRMTQTFLKKDGDIREVLKTMFKSPEFWSDDAYRAKVKTPLEFVVSAVRATNADVTDAMTLARQLANMGMPLYGMQPPTGYSMLAESWVNSSALLGRMNFSLALMSGRMKGVQVDAGQLVPLASSNPAPQPPDSQLTLAQLEASLLSGDISAQTHDAIVRRLDDPQVTQRKLDDPARAPNIPMIAGLILGSPEFQRR